MEPDIKEIIRIEYVHGYINDKGQRVMQTYVCMKSHAQGDAEQFLEEYEGY